MANDKTEKATPKKRAEARKKGQVARSADLSGALVMLVGILLVAGLGARIASRLGDLMRTTLLQTADPSVVDGRGLGPILSHAGMDVLRCVGPIALACCLTGVVLSVLQVGFKPSLKALKPDPKRLNPVSGAKNIFGKNMPVEAGKSIAKLLVVGGVVAMTLLPRITQMGAMVGVAPATIGSSLAALVRSIAIRAGAAYLVIGVLDFAWQRHRLNKNLMMDKQEVKEEHKQYALPAEVRAAMRRRQLANARARMMQAVPTADVVVTNPTHFSVALRYDPSQPAPEVVAKGQDLVALRIRELASEHGVPVVPDPPLARALHASVEVGRQIPEELFHGVAQVLAFVYRTAARRKAIAA
jgi:flagellar biosynthetic protein FlhB